MQKRIVQQWRQMKCSQLLRVQVEEMNCILISTSSYEKLIVKRDSFVSTRKPDEQKTSANNGPTSAVDSQVKFYPLSIYVFA